MLISCIFLGKYYKSSFFHLNMGNSDFSTEKVLDIIFDTEISEILADMENEPKHCSVLSEKFGITPKDLEAKLSYLLQHNFVSQTGQVDDITYSVDSEKLGEIMQSGHDYKNVEDSLTKMDSFLN